MFRRIYIFCFFAITPLAVFGQSSSQVARLTQDVQLMNEQLGKMRLQVESLQRTQNQLLDSFDRIMKRQNDLVANYQTLVADTESKINELPEREAAMKREIITEVSKQINALAAETQKAIDTLAKANSAKPQVQVKTNFSDDYPETGIVHVVKRGETISGIARQHGSTIQDIMNANRIANATGLKAGETIFVPVNDE
ncbi:MAG: LysM peptidoglycan-binding domain-containing protein [Verrucomicrobiota bacterium]